MKKLFNILFSVSLLFIVLITTIRFKIVEPVLDEIIANKISNYMKTEIKSNLKDFGDDIVNLAIEKVVNEEKIDVLSIKLRQKVLNDLTSDGVSDFDMSSELNYLIGDLSSLYRSIAKIFIKNIDINKVYNDMFLETKNKIPSGFITILNIYNTFTSDSVISLVSVLIALSLFIIIIKNKSIVNTLNEIGMSLFIDGIIMIVLLFFLKRVEVLLTMLPEANVDINLFVGFTFTFIILGFILKDIEFKKRN